MTVNTAVFWEMASCNLVTSYHRIVETHCLYFGERSKHQVSPTPWHLSISTAQPSISEDVILTTGTSCSIKNRNFTTNNFHCFGMHNSAFAAIYCVWGTCTVFRTFKFIENIPKKLVRIVNKPPVVTNYLIFMWDIPLW
jgi:hypothetical protein